MSKLVFKWFRYNRWCSFLVFSCSFIARDVRTKCMYADAKIGICLVGMKVLRKQMRLFAYSGKLDCIRQFKEYTCNYCKNNSGDNLA